MAFNQIDNGCVRRRAHPVVSRGLGVSAIAVLALAASSAKALVIQATFDSSITSLPNASVIEAAFNNVAAEFDSAFPNPVTVGITVSWGSVAGQAIPSGDVSASLDNLIGSFAYTDVTGYLAAASLANPTDQALATAVANLPVNDPTRLNNFEIPYAEAQALGVLPAKIVIPDGYIGFNNKVVFDFNSTNGVAKGDYDFSGLAAHEIEEVLGRITGLQRSGIQWATPLDLFRYTAPGVSSFSYNSHAYFSIDGGVTDLGNFNYTGNGDRSDWLTFTSSTDIQDAYYYTGTNHTLSGNDLTGLDILGWGGWSGGPLGGLGFTTTSYSPVSDAAIPEPSVWVMCLLGFGIVGAAVRRRRPIRQPA